MYKLLRNTFRDIEMFEAVLAGRRIDDLADEHGLSRGHTRDVLYRLVRRMYFHFSKTRPELDFTRFRTQSSPRQFLKDKEDWVRFINLYKQHCLAVQAEENHNQQ